MKKTFISLLIGLGFAATLSVAQAATPMEAIGTIETPPGVEEYQNRSGDPDSIALIFFISNMISIFTVIMGIYVLFNFIIAGMTYVASSGDAGTHEKVRQNITQSVIGLVLIVMAYTITGLISYIFFGDPAFILSPRL
ncbi:MAG: hypothetical protein WDZ94_05250 [Patescibacteria group bacterium]